MVGAARRSARRRARRRSAVPAPPRVPQPRQRASCGSCRRNILAASALQIDDRPSATVKRGQQVEVTTTVKPLAAGYHVLHGAALTFGDALGLFDIEAFFPNPIAVKVFPRTLALRGQPVRAVGGALHEQVGLHHVRRRGLSGELRELREHTPRRSVQVHRVEGDRAARPADGARPRERDRDARTSLLVDVGARHAQRPARPRAARLGVRRAAALAKAAIGNGDRIGLVGVRHAAASSSSRPTPATTTTCSSSTACSTRAASSTRTSPTSPPASWSRWSRATSRTRRRSTSAIKVAPPLDDPRWIAIQAGPDGQLYDVAATGRLCKRLIDVMLGNETAKDKRAKRAAGRRGRPPARAAAPVLPAARHRAAVPHDVGARPARRRASPPRSSARSRTAAPTSRSSSATSPASPRTRRARSARIARLRKAAGSVHRARAVGRRVPAARPRPRTAGASASSWCAISAPRSAGPQAARSPRRHRDRSVAGDALDRVLGRGRGRGRAPLRAAR